METAFQFHVEQNNAGNANTALPAWIGVSDGGNGVATILEHLLLHS